MFDLSSYPPAARSAFAGAPVLWPNAVSAAIDDGIEELDKLADLAFFMHHKERVSAGKGRPLSRGEPEFDALAAQWGGLREMIRPMVEADGPATPSEAWSVPESVAHDLRAMGGEPLVEWARRAPSGDHEAREFDPVREQTDDFRTVIAWKSRDPARTCLASRRRVQAIFMLRDDIAYWRARTDGETEAQMRQAAQEASIKSYRQHVVRDGICPAGARLKEEAEQERLLLQMATEFFAMIPVPAAQGTKSVKSLGELIKAVGTLTQSR